MPEDLKARADYFRLMNLNGAAHVYREAVREGFLDALAAGPRAAEDLARVCRTDERATRLLLHVLETLGVVRGGDAGYALTPLAGLLLGSTYRDLGDTYWAHLPEFLRTGKPLVTMDAVAQSEGFYKAQASALAWMLGPAAELAAEQLGIGTRLRDLRVLDLGAGSAVWSLAMAARDPGTTVTAVDWPAVLDVARTLAAGRGLADRLECVPGNYHEVDLPEGAFDLVVLANVTHLETADGNRRLLQRAHSALRKGGRVAIFDVFAGQVEGDLNRTLYALGLALRTAAGRVYGRAELEALLRDSGFEASSFLPLPVPPSAVGALFASRAGS